MDGARWRVVSWNMRVKSARGFGVDVRRELGRGEQAREEK